MSSSNRILFLLGVGLAVLLGACGDDDPTGPYQPDYASADLCLFLKDDDPQTLAQVLSDYDFSVVAIYGAGRFVLVEGEADASVLAGDERIVAFQQDSPTVVSSPVEITMSFFEGDFEDELPSQDALAPWALDQVHTMGRGEGVRVAVLDTGVDPTHPLLAGRVQLIEEGEWGLGSLERELGLDSDGDSLVDEAFGHGTHVTGIVATVAPAAEILVIRVLDSDGVGSAFDLARGLYRALEWGAQVINLSLVLSAETEVIDEVLHDLREQKVIVVGAAGNRPGEPYYPATESDVLSIAAVDHQLALANFSAYEGVRLAAPGVQVLSAFPGERWASATGTSMASASASGAMAILTAMRGSAEEAESSLRNTAIELAPVNDGVIDLLTAAYEAASEMN